MGLVKQAILALRLEGFREAETAAKRIALALAAAQRIAQSLGATPIRLGGGTPGRFPGALGLPGPGPRAPSAPFPTGPVFRSHVPFSVAERAPPFAAQGITAQLERVRGSANAVGESMRQAFSVAALRVFGERAVTTMASVQAAGTAVAGAVRGAFAAAGLAVAGVGALAYGAFSALERGERVSALTRSFERLSQATGGAAATLGSLERATGGGVAQQDLMVASNRLLVANLDLSRERMEALFQAGTRLGRALGVGATDAVNRLSLALSKQEPELLDELGLKVDLTKAVRDYAHAQGIAVEDVDAQARARVFLNAVERQAIERSAELGGAVAATAAPTERLAKRWKDLTDGFALMLTQQPGIFAGLEAIARAAAGLLSALTPVFEVLGKIVEALSKVPGLVPALAGAGAGGLAAGPLGAAVGFAGGAVLGAVGHTTDALGGGASGGPGGPGAAGGRGGASIPVEITVPLHDRTIDETAERVGRAIAHAAHRRLDDVRGSLERGLRRALDQSYGGVFTG